MLFETWKAGGKPIRLANGVMLLAGITRRQKWRALQELKTLGLISIENRPRKSPEITLLYPMEVE
jgi:hypothetical protein